MSDALPGQEKAIRLADDPEFQHYLVSASRRVAHELNLPTSVAEDIYQSVRLALSHLSSDRTNRINNLRAYASKMARNEAIKFYLRNKNLRESIDADPDPSRYSDRAAGARSVESRILLRDIWTHLDVEDRGILQLLIFGYDTREIANRLGISHASARQRIVRFRKRLRKLIFDVP